MFCAPASAHTDFRLCGTFDPHGSLMICNGVRPIVTSRISGLFGSMTGTPPGGMIREDLPFPLLMGSCRPL